MAKHSCYAARLSISVFSVGIVLVCISSSADIYTSANTQLDTPTIECFYENAAYWHNWWYDWYNISTFISDPTFRNGTRCYNPCPSNCTCSLGNGQITINCTNGSVSAVEVLYPPDVSSLSWENSTLQLIEKNAFTGLASWLRGLHLNNVGLEALQPYVFKGLSKLNRLDLRNNMLREIQPGVFKQLENLALLDLRNNMLDTIQPGMFEGIAELKSLNLNNNKLGEVQPGLIEGLTKLQWLYLRNNMLSEIQTGMFEGLTGLQRLYLSDNMLSEIKCGAFQGLTKLRQLGLSNNMISEIQPGVYEGLTELQLLDLSNNILEDIQTGLFQGLTKLKWLYLYDNVLYEIRPETFGNMHKLIVLQLSYNQLTHLYADTFRNQSRLSVLILSNNRIQSLVGEIFQYVVRLTFLDLSGNTLGTFNAQLFQNNVMLETLNLTRNDLLWITRTVFNGLNVSTNIYVDQFATCCFVTFATCISGAPRTAYLTCERMLTYGFLRIGVWVVSFTAILGNSLVLYTRCRQRQQRNNVQLFLITNLSISDLSMGIYLMVLLSVDLYYKDFFPAHSDSWRKSVLCKLIGALSVLSSEASVFFITLISIDRLLGIKYPFSGHRLGTKSARIMVSLLWVVAFGISLASFVLAEVDSNVYAVSEICVGLPISRKNMYEAHITSVRLSSSFHDETTIIEHEPSGSKVGMYFSIAIFIGLNLLCFLIVGYCYLCIFISVRKSAKESARLTHSSEDIRMAKKLSLIVLTDFCCWVPLGVLSILVQSGAMWVNPVGYAIIATFILPLNSSINPFLYTLATRLFDRQTCLQCRTASDDRTRYIDPNIQMRTINS